MSHQINSTSCGQQSGKKADNPLIPKSLHGPSEMNMPHLGGTPLVLPPKSKANKSSKHESGEKERSGGPSQAELEEFEKQRLHKKIADYLTNKWLRKKLENIQPPGANANLVMLRCTLDRINGTLLAEAKEQMVDMMFETGLRTTEEIMVRWAKLDAKRGLANAAMQSKDDLFQPELAELTMELSDSLVPGPGIRFAMKLCKFVQNFDGRVGGGMPVTEEEQTGE